MNEWREIKLKKVIKRIFSGGTPSTKREDYWGGELLWLSSGETNKKYISDTEKKITELGAKESSTKLAKKNSVVIASAGQGKTRGQVSFLKRDMFINQSIIAIEVDVEYILPKYLLFNLSSRYNEIRILSDASSSRGSITTGFLNKLTISVPNINTQKKIVDILSGYDKLIENNNRRIQILEQTAEELYKEWFVRMRFPGYEKTKFGKGIPEGWEVKKVKGLVRRYRYGSLYKENDVMQEGNVIVIDQSEKDFLGFHNNEPDHFAGIDNPIILFGDHSCKMLIMTSPFSLSENVIPFNAENNLNTLFLFYAIRGLVHTTEYKRHWSDLTNKRILVPDYSLQQKFEAKVKSIIILINEYKKSNLNLIKQRDLLLPRLMNGTITVK